MILKILKRIVKKVVNKRFKENNYHPFTKLPLNPSGVQLVVDVGAYAGFYSRLALNYYKNSRVVSFEPSSENAKLFIKNLQAEYLAKRVEFHNVAVSNFKGEAYLNLTNFGPSHSLEKQSLEHGRQNPNVFEVGNEKTLVVTLDEALIGYNKIDILKIDTEGHELSVLEGGLQVLSRTLFIIVEISLARDFSVTDQNIFKIFKILNDNDFYLYSIIDLYEFPKPENHLGIAQFDAIFKNKKI